MSFGSISHGRFFSSQTMDPENQSVANSDVASSKANEKEKEEECSVCVAVNIRPLIANEIVVGCQECLGVDAAQAQVTFCREVMV